MKKKVILLPILFCIFTIYTLIYSSVVNAYEVSYELMSDYIGIGSNSNIFSVGQENINPEVLFNFYKVYYEGEDCLDVRMVEIDPSNLEVISSDEKILEVKRNDDGNVVMNALSEGIAYLDISYTFNNKKYDCISNFTDQKERIPCYVCKYDDEIEGGSSIVLTKSNLEIEKGKTENVEVKQLEFGSADTNATYQCKYVWSSKDKSIATVTGENNTYEKSGVTFVYGSIGTITAVSEGETEIYCKVISKDKTEEVIKKINVKVIDNTDKDTEEPDNTDNEKDEKTDDTDKEKEEEKSDDSDKKDDNKEKEWVNPFWDVKQSNWFYDAVKFVNKNGIILGYNETTFAPYDKLTRAMIVTILYRMENPTVKYSGVKFDDVEANKWYTEPVMWAYKNGIVHGYEGTNKFGPNDNIKRQDLAVILRNYAKFKGKDVDVTASVQKFSDYTEISSYANTAMQWAVGKGVITGNKNGTLAPKDNATRAEAAAMIQKYSKNINEEE